MLRFDAKALVVITLMSIATLASASTATITGLKVVRIAADASGSNRFVVVSPAQPQCYAVGDSTLLFNNPATDPNTAMIYASLLAAMMADKTIDVIHDGTSYCTIVRVTVVN